MLEKRLRMPSYLDNRSFSYDTADGYKRDYSRSSARVHVGHRPLEYLVSGDTSNGVAVGCLSNRLCRQYTSCDRHTELCSQTEKIRLKHEKGDFVDGQGRPECGPQEDRDRLADQTENFSKR